MPPRLPAEGLLQELLDQLRVEFPGFEVRFKDQSPTQRALGRGMAVLGADRYLSSFVTVFGHTVWWTSRADFEDHPTHTLNVLLHERVHLWDWNRSPLWFPTSYLFCGPTVWTKRAEWERRAYAVDLVLRSRLGVPEDWLVSWMKRVFSCVDYGYMWPFPEQVEAWAREVIRDGFAPTRAGDDALYESTERWIQRLEELAAKRGHRRP